MTVTYIGTQNITPSFSNTVNDANGIVKWILYSPVISKFSMVAIGVLEMIQLENVSRNKYYDLKTIPMSIVWKVPQYFLIGYARVFTSIDDWSSRVLL